MYIGSTSYSKVYAGSSQVQKIYKGSTQVYSAYAWDTDALSLISRMTTQPNNSLKVLINDTIISLKIAGIYSKLDCLYMFNVHDSQAACQNWAKNSHNVTISGSPIFIPSVGFQGDGVSAALNLNYTLGDQGVNFTQNNNSQGFSMFKTPSSQSAIYGGRYSSWYIGAIVYMDGSSGTYLHANQTSVNGAATYGAPVGSFVTFNRDNATDERAFRDGANKLTFSKASSNTPSVQMKALAFWDYNATGGYNTSGLSTLFFGASLTDGENATLSTIIKYFKDNVGQAISGYDADTEYLVYRMASAPTTALKNLIDVTIRGLKEDGVWYLTDCMYVRGLHTAQASLLNWKRGICDGTSVNSPTFTPKIGFKGNGTSSYINNNYVPSWHKQFCKKADATISYITKQIGTATSYLMGAYRSAGAQALAVYYRPAANDTAFLFSINDFNQLNISNDVQYTVVNNGVDIRGYSDGTLTGSPGSISTYNEPIYSTIDLGWNNAGVPGSFYNGNIAFSFYGGALNQQQVTALYNRIKYFYDNVDSTF